MPWFDWQFWIVTLLAMWGVWILAAPLPPSKARCRLAANMLELLERQRFFGETPACRIDN